MADPFLQGQIAKFTSTSSTPTTPNFFLLSPASKHNSNMAQRSGSALRIAGRALTRNASKSTIGSSSSSICRRTLATAVDKLDLPTQAPEPVTVQLPESALGFEVSLKDTTREAVGTSLSSRPIYLDAQATTPVDPRVLDKMLPFMTNQYGNPHSRTHAYGWEAEAAVNVARQHLGDLIGANEKDMIFTSGATESNNLAIKGVARFYGRSGKKHIITLQTEHKCVLDSCRYLQDEGFDVTYLPVQTDGTVDLEVLKNAIRPDTCLVSVGAWIFCGPRKQPTDSDLWRSTLLSLSLFPPPSLSFLQIMAVNNEVGVIQPMKEIGEIVKSHKGVFFHSDIAQATGKIPVNVDQWKLDLASISGHKIYGPKGIGAIYIRRRPRVRVEPLISGGGQERGLRSGTLAPHLVVGIGEAARLCKQEMQVRHVFNVRT